MSLEELRLWQTEFAICNGCSLVERAGIASRTTLHAPRRSSKGPQGQVTPHSTSYAMAFVLLTLFSLMQRNHRRDSAISMSGAAIAQH